MKYRAIAVTALIAVLFLVACGNQAIYNSDFEEAMRLMEEDMKYLQSVINGQAEEIAWLQSSLTNMGDILTDNLVVEEIADESNPIDRFFSEIADTLPRLHDSTHNSMVVHSVLIGTAWRAEVEHLRDILSDMTWNDFAKETINDMIYHYREYTQHQAEVWAMITATNAFDDWGGIANDGIFYGSLARIVRSAVIADGYRDLALELLGLIEITSSAGQQVTEQSDFSIFVFDEEDFLDWMKEEHPWLWEQRWGGI